MYRKKSSRVERSRGPFLKPSLQWLQFFFRSWEQRFSLEFLERKKAGGKDVTHKKSQLLRFGIWIPQKYTRMSMKLSNYLVSWVVTYLGDLQQASQYCTKKHQILRSCIWGQFLQCRVSPTTIGFPTKDDQHLGCETGVPPFKETLICLDYV